MDIRAVMPLVPTALKFEETEWDSEVADEYRQLLLVRIHKTDGTVGLGETYPRPTVDAAVIHEHIAPEPLDRSPGDIEGIWRDTFRRADY
jgi:L-alanine-DL-glutamate epimerase-like enolase superfamily enzyme